MSVKRATRSRTMMQTETVFKLAFGVWAVLFIMPVARANRKAKLEHG